jgi:hypothetical protein
MQVESVNCNNCGAPLEVGAATRFVTCAHCGTRLAVKRTASSAFTETLDRLDQKTDVMARQLAELRHHAELERIDREWEQERQGFLTTDKQGNKHEPTAAGGIIGGLILIVFGLFFAVSSGSMGAPGLFPCAGLAFVGFGVFLLIAGPKRAREYEQAKEAYRRRRAAVTVDQFHLTDDREAG